MSERFALALMGSLALHVALALGIAGQPRVPGGDNLLPITASLEYPERIDPAALPSEPETPEPAVSHLEAPASVDTTAQADAPTPAVAPAGSPLPAVKPESSAPGSAFDIPVIRDPTYYAGRFLDEYPRPLNPIEPRYPERASKGDISGTVTLLLLIDEDGTLNEISVVEANPASIFDEAALAAFRDARFSPARKDGRAVRSRVLITVGFEANKPPSAR